MESAHGIRTDESSSSVGVLCTRERMDCVTRPCFESVSTKFLSSSLMAVSWSILACREEKIAGSTLGVAAAALAIAVSLDMVSRQNMDLRSLHASPE